MLERVQNWYEAKVGETFTIGTWITRQGNNSWQYYNNGDTFSLVKDELNAAGEHVLQSGYVYLVFFAGGGGFAAGATDCSATCGYSLVGHYVVDSYQRPADQDPWRVSNYQSQIGTIAHELGHAMNIGPHVTGNNLMAAQWNWPLVDLNATQIAALKTSPLITAPGGSAPRILRISRSLKLRLQAGTTSRGSITRRTKSTSKFGSTLRTVLTGGPPLRMVGVTVEPAGGRPLCTHIGNLAVL
jgi:hypothetical protein